MSTQTQNINTFLSQVTTKSITTNQTSCTSTATANQSIVINNDLAAVAQKCNTDCATASAPTPCYATCQLLANAAASGTVTVSDIKQVAQVSLSASCTVLDDTSKAVRQDVVNAVTQKMNDTSDDLGTAMKGIVSSISKSSDSTVNQNQVQSLVDTTFTTTNLQTFVNNVATSQAILINNGVATGVFNNLSQQSATQAMTDMVATNKTLESVTQAVTNSADQAITKKSEVLPGVQDGIASLLGGIGSLFSSPLLIIGAVVVVILIVLVMFMK